MARLAWQVKVTDEYAAWFTELIKTDLGSATLVAQAARSEIRIIFAFDRTRSALLLLGGDKAGNWERWYRENIPIAERLYREYTTDGDE